MCVRRGKKQGTSEMRKSGQCVLWYNWFWRVHRQYRLLGMFHCVCTIWGTMRTNGAFLRTSFGHQQTSSPDPSSQGGAVNGPGRAGQVRSHTLPRESQEGQGPSQVRLAGQQLTQGRSLEDPGTKPKLPGQQQQQQIGQQQIGVSGPRKIITHAIIEHQSIRNRPLPAIPSEEKDENRNLTHKTASLGRQNKPPSLVKSNQQILTKAELQQHIQSQLNVIYWTTSSSSG